MTFDVSVVMRDFMTRCYDAAVLVRATTCEHHLPQHL